MSSARLLILGVLLRKQPIHGYEVRRELETWNVEQWTNVAYGSIYFALNKMSEEGLVEAVGSNEETKKRAGRTQYIITDKGKEEFERLLRQYWWERKPMIDPFMVAVSLMDKLPHEELVKVLHFRVDTLRSLIPAFKWSIEVKSQVEKIPRFVIEQLKLSVAHFEVELHWTEAILEKVERGELP